MLFQRTTYPACPNRPKRTRKTRGRSLFILIGSLVLFACASLPAPTSDSEQSNIPSPATDDLQPLPTLMQGDLTPMTPPTQSTSSIPGLPDLVQKAREDLSQRLSIPVEQITLTDARAVTWPNSSLGCPQPGMLYTEVLTPGYLILLQVDGQEYEYHAGKSLEVFPCENPTPPVPGIPGDV